MQSEGQSQDDPIEDIASLAETTAQLISCRECKNVIGTPTVCQTQTYNSLSNTNLDSANTEH